MSRLTWKISAITDIGLQRLDNQDNYYISPDEKVFVVADGMGGAADGAIASKLAIESVQKAWEKETPNYEDFEHTRAWLLNAVALANKTVLALPSPNYSQKPGTTIVAAVQTGDGNISVAHVGDSRAYAFRSGEPRRLTQDHTLVAEMVSSGQITEDQAALNPYRHMLTRCLGHDPNVKIDHTVFELQPGDWALLCTDGVCGVLTDDEIADAIQQSGSPTTLCQELFENIMERKAPDNLTMIVLQYQ